MNLITGVLLVGVETPVVQVTCNRLYGKARSSVYLYLKASHLSTRDQRGFAVIIDCDVALVPVTIAGGVALRLDVL